MAYGINRFLTTHTGSLPRPDDLIRAMFAKEEGVPVDRTGLAAKIRSAVAGVVKKQVDSGNLVGRDNVIAGSDCGFGTWVGQAAVDPDVVWAKLAAMAEGARLATRQFWGG
jgi:methionine synthase II (cobalamin-independent)